MSEKYKNIAPLEVGGGEVCCFKLNGVFVKKYRNCNEASEDVNVSAGAIRNAALGITKQSGGYQWKFERDCEPID